MNNMDNNLKEQDFDAIGLRVASPDKILSWSHGEVTKPETINYRTQRAERDGLFCERIFGPEKDYECYCGKYRRVRYKGIICDKCGVEVTRSIVRRERMGHIKLAAPVSHIWFLRGVPSKMSLVLDVSVSDLEKVIYFAGYIVTKVDEAVRANILGEIEREFKAKTKAGAEKTALKSAADQAKAEVKGLHVNQVLSEVEYHRLSLKYANMFEAGIGAETLRAICANLDLDEVSTDLMAAAQNAQPLLRKKILKRLQLMRAMQRSGVRPEWMFMTIIPIIPPALRPMVALDGGRHATSDVNDLYRRVINRNNRLKRLYELKAPEVICRNEKRMLQEAVDALIDNSIRRGQAAVTSQAQKRPLRSLADMLKGKQGRFRQNLLGKRVDYSGRSVIVVGPELKLHQCGLPKHMALELFRPFVIQKLIERGLAYNIRGAGKIIEDATPEVWAILEEVIDGKYVLLNRAPTLHRLGIQAFQPLLIEGNAIRLHPLVCPAFNADFDGDQMAVHVPLTEEAQYEAREIMAAHKNLLKPGTGDAIVGPQQDMVLGCYWLTKLKEGDIGEGKIFSSPDEALMAYEFGVVTLHSKIKVRLSEKYNQELIETTVGRLIFNEAMPEGMPFVNEQLAKKHLSLLTSKIIRKFGVEATGPFLDRIKTLGFTYATKSGISWGYDDVKVPIGKQEIIKEATEAARIVQDQFDQGLLTDSERYSKIIEIWQGGVKQKIDQDVRQNTLDPEGPIYAMVNSAARGSWVQVNQMSGMKGMVVNPSGRIIELPILSSYKEGLNVLEYFISTHGARKGTADTALKTAAAGYLTRRLVDVAQDLIIREADCGDDRGILVFRKDSEDINKTFTSRLFGRTALTDIKHPGTGAMLAKKGELISIETAEAIDKAGVESASLRSPVSCRTIRGVCQVCYGYDLGSNAPIKLGEAIGIVAAQAIGEPGTQLTMRTFHIGGVAGGADITLGLPRVEEIFEIRTPKSKAIISEIAGDVLEIKEAGKEKIVRVVPSDEADEDAEERDTPEKEPEDKKEIREYSVPFGKAVLVKEGDHVTRGHVLSDGVVDVKELFKVGSMSDAQNYIIREVGKIYALQGSPINDKHIEVIVRQMFSRVRIKHQGSSRFSVDELVERDTFLEENTRIRKSGEGDPAKAVRLLMGISKTALSVGSFLSAASFQETTRVLINAAVEGQEDHLRGLKENVIIGRLIPAGTGFRKDLPHFEHPLDAKEEVVEDEPAPALE
ncbi:MAG: DNA-directed RNA polymerase subunit beta' [Candidatus Ryanbacteria bacterium RIFCSPHIGHO2_01_FULL_48_27]|uniref:DNA-directed RNA polymerase subunit beta' n=1 Tax=Candidatus Ryanbacteria bacterium RIFCSPHIGHO2_01_FULL_48_27 TaxID=1802115 RepID=A0A1G2G4S5_9BACT|nr:MAG: DNA-directed RNA polymerase subunit beta' [Candidatus Ryanbacteria bacterium RIFCSPHIGHO2_01_FULL_48_27]